MPRAKIGSAAAYVVGFVVAFYGHISKPAKLFMRIMVKTVVFAIPFFI